MSYQGQNTIVGIINNSNLRPYRDKRCLEIYSEIYTALLFVFDQVSKCIIPKLNKQPYTVCYIYLPIYIEDYCFDQKQSEYYMSKCPNQSIYHILRFLLI